MLPLTLHKLAALHYLLHCRAWGCCWLLGNESGNAFCFPVQSEKGNQCQSPMVGSRKSPRWADSTRVWKEGEHRTELRFFFPKAHTQRRMGTTKQRGTWTKRHKGVAFPSPWESKIPAKGQETMVEKTSWQKRGHLMWQGRRGVQSWSSPGFHSELSEISCTNTVFHFPSGRQDPSSLTPEIKKPCSA